MAVRVLGYKTVVESKGTWPTNYIAKAQELKVLKDVTYGTYADGAVRGNVALIIWNMLRTPMWDVTSESEKDGLTYGKAGGTMIDKYFEDYTYATVKFGSFSIEDGKVMVTLTEELEEKEPAKLENAEYEYAGNDFYTFVEGQEVEVLVNEKDETLLTMVSTGTDTIKEGTKVDVDDDYKELRGTAYDYAYIKVKSKKIEKSTTLTVEDAYIWEKDSGNKTYVKFNKDSKLKFVYDDAEDLIFIKNGERITVKDIEIGDVLSKVEVGDDSFYVITDSKVEGKLSVVAEKQDQNNTTYATATIAKEVYRLSNKAVYFEDPEDEDADAEKFDTNSWVKEMKGEVVEAKLNFIGDVVAVLFDGEINAGEDSENVKVGFYGITGEVEGRYELGLMNEEGKGSDYKFAKNTIGRKYESQELQGTFTVVSFDEDDDIEELQDYKDNAFMLKANKDGEYDFSQLTNKVYYGDEENEYYTIASSQRAEYNKDNKSIKLDDDKSVKVNKDTVVVTLTYDDKGTTRTKDDECKVEFSQGISAIEKLKNEPAVVITDAGNKFASAKYVVIFDEVSNKEDNLLGIVANIERNKLGSSWLATITETRITDQKELDKAKKDAITLKATDTDAEDYRDNYQFVLYSIEENKNGDQELTIKTGLINSELTAGNTDHGYIAKSTDSDNKNVSKDGRSALVELNQAAPADIKALLEDGKIYLDDKNVVDFFEDYKVVIVNVELDDDFDGDVVGETQYYATSFSEVDYDKVSLKELDRISIDTENEYITIIRGMVERP